MLFKKTIIKWLKRIDNKPKVNEQSNDKMIYPYDTTVGWYR